MATVIPLGLGVDVGGSGSRFALFAQSSHGSLIHLESTERRRDGNGLAAELIAGLQDVLARVPSELRGPLILGIAAPGAKTANQRGILRARYLASEPTLLDEVRNGLTAHATARIVQPTQLFSDAQAALVGETVVDGGVLTGVTDALFLGPGSGLGEAKLCRGSLGPTNGPRAADLPPVNHSRWFADLEEQASLQGLNNAWSQARGLDLEQPALIEQAVQAGDARARRLLEEFAGALARVVESRIEDFEELREASTGSSPVLLVRSRRGQFFANQAVRAAVMPALMNAAENVGARLVIPSRPALPHAACAGALALALRQQENPPTP